MEINESDGLVVNVTVGNSGPDYVNTSFNVTLYIQNENNIFHKFLDQFTVNGLGAPGNRSTFSFSNWTDMFISGDYVINVTTHLFNDSNPLNDTELMGLHVDPISL